MKKQSYEQKVYEECIKCKYPRNMHPVTRMFRDGRHDCEEFVSGEREEDKYYHSADCRGFPNELYLKGDLLGGHCTCIPVKEGATNPCGCDNNQLECSRRREEAYDQGFLDGQNDVLEDIKHEQQKLLDGWGHPKDCVRCKKK